MAAFEFLELVERKDKECEEAISRDLDEHVVGFVECMVDEGEYVKSRMSDFLGKINERFLGAFSAANCWFRQALRCSTAGDRVAAIRSRHMQQEAVVEQHFADLDSEFRNFLLKKKEAGQPHLADEPNSANRTCSELPCSMSGAAEEVQRWTLEERAC